MSFQEPMAYLEWEKFSQEYFVIQSGALGDFISKINIQRDANLNLHFEATGLVEHTTPVCLMGKTPPGLLDDEDIPPVIIRDAANNHGEIRGAIVTKAESNISIKESKTNIIQKGKIKGFNFKLNNSMPERLTEWLINLESRFTWPLSTKHNTRILYNRSRGVCLNDDEIENIAIELGMRFNNNTVRDCMEISLEQHSDLKIIIGNIHNTYVSKNYHPGFITYYFPNNEKPSKKLRDMVRAALSFAFGKYITYLGYTSYDINWKAVDISVIDVYIPGGVAAFNNPSYPPTMICDLNKSYMLDTEKLNTVVNGFIKNFEQYNLQYIMFLYWHTHASTIYTKPVQLTAIIESLIRKNCKINNIKESLIPKNIRVALIEKLIETYKGFCEEHINGELEEEIKIIDNKIKNNLMQTPASYYKKSFFKMNNLEIGQVEEKAIKMRAKAAHGGTHDPQDGKELIKHIDALIVLCNRIILRLITNCTQYVDYYSNSTHPPLRDLAISIPTK